MQLLDKLIQQFWKGEVTVQESIDLEKRLEQPDNAWKKSLQESFENNLEKGLKVIESHRSDSILQAVHKKIGESKPTVKAKVISIKRSWLWVAAASIAVIFFGVLLFNQNGGIYNNNNSIVSVSGVNKPKLIYVKNNSDTVEILKLEDGSKVELQPNSSVSYTDPFIQPKRDISLNGIAFFKVAKDKTRPFTVFAGQLSTTALGTSFLVSAPNKEKSRVKVKLYTGKVVIRSIASLKGWINDVYLTPYKQMEYDMQSGSVNVSAFKDKVDNKIDESNSLPVKLEFTNEPLANVFQKLGTYYDIKIQFNPAHLAGIVFTGSINKSDKIESVLQSITRMNGLSLSHKGNSYSISR